MSKQMSVREAVLKRRATKAYLEEVAPSKEDIDLITDAGLWAPTANNIQNSMVIAVVDKEFKKEMANHFLEFNKLQVETAQAVFLLVGTPWKDDKVMKEMLVDHSISRWGLPNEELVNQIAEGVVQYNNTAGLEFRDNSDIYGSATQLGMMMLQATELGYDTNGMLGYDPKGLANFLVEKNIITKDQRVNVTFSMGHRDENHERNKLAHNRIEKERLVKVI